MMQIQKTIAEKMSLAAVGGFLRLENLLVLHHFDVVDLLMV
jgi:hypothetical protein